MPLGERDQGYNEGIAAAEKLFADRSHQYYDALRLIADGTVEADMISKRAYQLGEDANKIRNLRRLSPEEIAENEEIDRINEERGFI